MKLFSRKPTNFWAKLPQPFFCLAPMADVTDAAFRQIVAKYGKPNVMWTEFVSVDGLMSDIGRQKLLIDLAYSKKERPIVAQIFGSKPENFFQTAKLIKDLGFDGIDINMGCPEKSINKKQCAGAELINHHKLAQEIILAAQEGSGGLPVSVKTRVGYRRDEELADWLPALLSTKPAAITIHARTKKDMSKVPARWDLIGQAVEMAKGSGVLIIGNGDVRDLTDARQKAEKYGCDGVMIGRGIFGNPWLFSGRTNISTKEKLHVMVEHARLYDKLLGADKPFAIMKKHFKAYVNGFDGAKELRSELMMATTADQVEEIVEKFLSQ